MADTTTLSAGNAFANQWHPGFDAIIVVKMMSDSATPWSKSTRTAIIAVAPVDSVQSITMIEAFSKLGSLLECSSGSPVRWLVWIKIFPITAFLCTVLKLA